MAQGWLSLYDIGIANPMPAREVTTDTTTLAHSNIAAYQPPAFKKDKESKSERGKFICKEVPFSWCLSPNQIPSLNTFYWKKFFNYGMEAQKYLAL